MSAASVSTLVATETPIFHVPSAALRDDLPLMPSLSDFFGSNPELNRTLFTLVKDDETVGQVITATRSVVGDLDQPKTGLLVVLPVDQTEGLEKKCE